MSIGPEIKEVLGELGTSFTIHYTDGSTATGEKLDFEFYPDNSSEFIRQNFYSATLAYDTAVVVGNVLSFAGDYFLATNVIASLFEDAIVEYSVPLYKCNITGGVIERFSELYDTNYVLQPNWADVYTNIFALNYETRFGEAIKDFNDVIELPLDSNLLFISSAYDIKVGDRFRIDASTKWKIERIATRRIQGLNILYLASDTRLEQ